MPTDFEGIQRRMDRDALTFSTDPDDIWLVRDGFGRRFRIGGRRAVAAEHVYDLRPVVPCGLHVNAPGHTSGDLEAPCIDCTMILPIANMHFDANGERFRAYYCDRCVRRHRTV